MHEPPPESFTGRIRRTFRRYPDMENQPLRWDELVDDTLIRLPLTLPIGALFVSLPVDDSVVPLIVLTLHSYPFGEAHVSGVRRRWWALGGAILVGWVVSLAISTVLDRATPWRWALFVGLNASVLVAAIAYTSITRIAWRAPGETTS